MKRIIIFLLCIASFGSLGVLSKMVPQAPSVFLAFMRVAIGLVIFGAFFKGSLPKPKDWKIWSAFALNGFFLATSFTLYMEAFKFATISDVVLLGFVDPILVTILAAAVLREKISHWAILSISFALAGVLVLMQAPMGSQSQELGLYIALLAVVAGASNVILIKWEEMHKAPLHEVLFYPFAFATMYLFFPAISSTNEFLSLGPAEVAIVALLGIATASGYFLYDTLISKWGAHITDLAVRVGITAFATIASVLFFGDAISQNWWVASALLFGSAFLLYQEAHVMGRPYEKRMHGHTH